MCNCPSSIDPMQEVKEREPMVFEVIIYERCTDDDRKCGRHEKILVDRTTMTASNARQCERKALPNLVNGIPKDIEYDPDRLEVALRPFCSEGAFY